MPSDSGDRRLAKPNNSAPPPEQEHLRCPRCDSSNTKFCYYNNYNLSQPRHFCKSCRRYWTQGGTLRNIPVGGGSRKNAKRSRTSFSSSSQDAAFPNPISASLAAEPDFSVPICCDLNLETNVSGSFTSLLNSQAPGFVALGGFGGLGLGSGLDEVGFGLGRGIWPFTEVVEGGANSSWQLGSGEGGFVDDDCRNLRFPRQERSEVIPPPSLVQFFDFRQ